jgi:hypothetical protein
MHQDLLSEIKSINSVFVNIYELAVIHHLVKDKLEEMRSCSKAYLMKIAT